MENLWRVVSRNSVTNKITHQGDYKPYDATCTERIAAREAGGEKIKVGLEPKPVSLARMPPVVSGAIDK